MDTEHFTVIHIQFIAASVASPRPQQQVDQDIEFFVGVVSGMNDIATVDVNEHAQSCLVNSPSSMIYGPWEKSPHHSALV